MNSASVMLNELQNNGEQFKMVQARLFQINRSLTGVSSFLPIMFDREYTCLTMSTIHSSLIDYRFRVIPQSREPAGTDSATVQSGQYPGEEAAKDVASGSLQASASKDLGSLDEEDQTFSQNGIVVENKFELNE